MRLKHRFYDIFCSTLVKKKQGWSFKYVGYQMFNAWIWKIIKYGIYFIKGIVVNSEKNYKHLPSYGCHLEGLALRLYNVFVLSLENLRYKKTKDEAIYGKIS